MIHTLTFLFVAVNLHFISSNLVVDRRGYRLYETIQRLNNQCFDYTNSLSADVYRWCFGQNATITRVDKENSKSNVHVLDRRLSLNTINPSVEIFHSTSADCFNGESYIEHSALINLQCCDTAGEGGNYLRFVHERLPCTYTFELCVESVCRIDDAIEETEQRAPGQQIVETSELTSLPPEEIIHAPVEQRPQHQRDPYASPRPSLGAVSKEDQLKLREEVREMFYHGYRGYMSLAYPASELKPIECTAGLFDLVKIPFVTLIDALDTLVIMGDYAEFRHAVSMLERDLQNFAFDVNVSLFETTIRVLGGLLAAHLMAVDPKLHIYVRVF